MGRKEGGFAGGNGTPEVQLHNKCEDLGGLQLSSILVIKCSVDYLLE